MLWPAGIILGLGPTNDRWRYIVTRSLIGLAHAQNATGPMTFMYFYSMLKTSIEIFSKISKIQKYIWYINSDT